MYIAVVGSGESDSKNEIIAYEIGALIAKEGFVLICGGLGGVMEAASKGTNENNGVSIGILPGSDYNKSSKYLTHSIATGLGEGRNAIIGRSCDVMIAVGGEFGTLSEIAFALKASKPVVGINTWQLFKNNKEAPVIIRATNAQDAFRLAMKAANK